MGPAVRFRLARPGFGATIRPLTKRQKDEQRDIVATLIEFRSNFLKNLKNYKVLFRFKSLNIYIYS